MSAPATAESLREIGLFGALSDDVIDWLAATVPVYLVAPGENIFHEGDQAREMFVVLSGEAEVLLTGGTDACVTPGMLFGFSRMKVVSMAYNDAPAIASRPTRTQRRYMPD